jgi:3-deoxy-D-manno-octulosonate 8-phosphate phosphatase (KDO 8-P phosphatase)
MLQSGAFPFIPLFLLPMTILDRFKQVKTFVFDVDGVLTDGTLLIIDEGKYLRRMHIRDGFAMSMAVKKGYRIAVISGADVGPVVQRLNMLGINDVYIKVPNKSKVLKEYVAQHNLNWNEILYMGDDVPDYNVSQLVGVPCAPADAIPEVKQVAKYISLFNGGTGCVRDVIEKVLKLNGHWDLNMDIASV